MPRRSVLSASERERLLTLPNNESDWIRTYAFSETDHALIRQRRGEANRFGFALQLCLLRYPGIALPRDKIVPDSLIQWIAQHLWLDASAWDEYGHRDETRREHLQILMVYLGLAPFGLSDFRILVDGLTQLALQTDKGSVLASHALQTLRRRQVVIPALPVVERACAHAITRANRRLYRQLVTPLTAAHRERLDGLLALKPDRRTTWLVWLRQSPLKPNSRHMLEHIARLRGFQTLDLPAHLGRDIHQNRLLKIAREGAQMTPRDLGKFETERRHATLAALALESRATATDEIIDLHDRILIKLFAHARNKHQQRFHSQGKAINDKVRLYSAIGHALLQARDNGDNAFDAIEQVMPWEAFVHSITEADRLARPGSFDHFHLLIDQFPTLRRYTSQFLTVLSFQAVAAAQPVLDAIDTLRAVNAANARAIPADAPTAFIRPRWRPLVFNEQGIDRRFYEICALTELKNALRSGDIWVEGSRQFRNFDDYLMPGETFNALSQSNQLPIVVTSDGDQYLEERLAELESQLATVSRLARDDELPDATFTETGLKLTPQETAVPADAQRLIDHATQLLPRIKITDLLMDVDEWTGFTRHFVHLKNEAVAHDRALLLSAILADGINLGLTKMAESCPGVTYGRLSWLQAWHIRDETYTAALAELTNTQLRHSFAGNRLFRDVIAAAVDI